jgi:hypothetical protein
MQQNATVTPPPPSDFDQMPNANWHADRRASKLPNLKNGVRLALGNQREWFGILCPRRVAPEAEVAKLTMESDAQ